MNYRELKKNGIKFHEFDTYDGGIYLNTYEYWLLDGEIYIHEIHPNLNRYTGKTHTEKFLEHERNYSSGLFCELVSFCEEKGLSVNLKGVR